jgi:hypothetical protein
LKGLKYQGLACRGATAGTRKIEKYDSARLYLSIQIPEAGTSMPFYITRTIPSLQKIH